MNALKNPSNVIKISAAIGGLIVFYAIFGALFNHSVGSIVRVSKMTLAEEVNSTGRIKPEQSIDLTFERGGRVAHVFADVGENVYAGQELVSMENGDYLAAVLQAEAGLKTQEANLAVLKDGVRPEDLQAEEVRVRNSQTALDNAVNGMIDKLQSSYTVADDAIRNKADELFSNPRSDMPQFLSTIISDNLLKSQIESERLRVETSLVNWKNSLNILDVNSDLSNFKNEAESSLSMVKSLLDKISLVVNSATPSANISQSGLSAWKFDISTARTNVDMAVSALDGAEEKIQAADSALNLENQNFTLKQAGATDNQLLVGEAQVEQAQASVKNAQAQLAKTIIYSPITGIITRQDAKLGQVVSPNIPIVSVDSVGKFELDTKVSESDVAKVKIGDKANVTVDAYGNNAIFEASVIKIDPAETIVNGVPTYKITLQFAKSDDRIKSGMTANIDIVTENKMNVVAVPVRAVITRGANKFVLVSSGGSTEERKVELGVKGSNDYFEVLSGLKEGESVINFGSI